MSQVMNMKEKVLKKLGQKVKGIDGYVVVIVLGVVAIAAGVIFKDQITAFITSFFSQFSSKASAIF